MQHYTAMIMHRVCVHLALGEDDGIAESAEELLAAAAMKALRVVSHAMGSTEDGLDLDARLFSQLQDYQEMPEGEGKRQKHEALVALLQPLADSMLKAAVLNQKWT